MATATRSMRDAFREAILEIARERDEVFILTADMGSTFGFAAIKEELGIRAIDAGIAEANMVGIAAGLARSGKIPVCFTFAFLLSMRALEQIRTDICYPDSNVKLFGYCGGLASGVLGNTHNAIEDIGIFKSLPNMTVVCPADARDTEEATRALMAKNGPAYIRMGRKDEPLLGVAPYEFTIGKAAMLRQGTDLTLIATGLMVKEALEAAEILAGKSIETRVLNMHTVKPLDEEAIRQAARETGGILTIEEHNLWGGMGESVAAIAATECLAPVRRIGIPDEFAVIGQQLDLWDRYGLNAAGIAATAQQML